MLYASCTSGMAATQGIDTQSCTTTESTRGPTMTKWLRVLSILSLQIEELTMCGASSDSWCMYGYEKGTGLPNHLVVSILISVPISVFASCPTGDYVRM